MNMQKLINPVLMWLIVAIGIAASFLFFSNEYVLERTIWSWLIFVFSIAIWTYIILNAIKIHRQPIASVDAINYLVTGGIYNIVRHPMYVADIILAWGIFFFWPAEQVLLSVIWLTFILWLWMKLEERALVNKFGIEYKDYIQRVPMVLPNVKKRTKKEKERHL